MYYTVYKTINKITGKIYIGCHKTKNLNDGYLGSGIVLKRAIEKYGVENFEKIILHVFEKSSEMFEMESKLVNDDFIKDDKTYNVKCGGNGGWDYINESKLSVPLDEQRKIDPLLSKRASILGNEAHREKMENPEYRKQYRLKVSKGLKLYFKSNPGTFADKNHTEETKRTIGEKNSKHQTGKGNSQYGTMWITNEKENKKIKKEQEIPEGWRKGRVSTK